MIIGLDGADKTGKTTQILQIKSRNPMVVVLPSMMCLSNSWYGPKGKNSYEHPIDWWAQNDGAEHEFINVFIEALCAREKLKKRILNKTVVLEDRSNILTLCSVLAWLKTRDNELYIKLRTYVIKLFYDNKLLPENNLVSYLLVNGNSVEERVQNTMKRIISNDYHFIGIYARYQHNFQMLIDEFMEDSIIINAKNNENVVYSNIVSEINEIINESIRLL